MLDAAVSVGLKHDPSVLKLYPDPLGMQHDETQRFPFKWARKIDREIKSDAPLHQSVLDRLHSSEVLQYDTYKRYDPPSLRGHQSTR